MNLFFILAKKAISVAFAEVLRRKAIRWMKGELSLQDGYERLWQRSAHADEGDEQLQEPRAMRELLPGLYHWQAFNTHISHEVDSYYAGLDPPALIDPMMPKEGIDWFRQHGEPAHIFMTNRLHDRDCQAFIDAFAATVWCHRAGLHEFEEDGLA